MIKQFLLLILTGCLLLSSPKLGFSADSVQEVLEKNLNDFGDKPELAGESIYAVKTLRAYYAARDFKPIWVTDSGTARESVFILPQAIDNIEEEGLPPELYHLEAIQKLLKDFEKGKDASSKAAAELEILASDAFLAMASNLAYGLINPERKLIVRFYNSRAEQMTAALEEAALRNRVSTTLSGLTPRSEEYVKLKAAYASYKSRLKEKEWPKIMSGEKLVVGDTGKRVQQLQERLEAEDYLTGGGGDTFDARLEAALIRYQKHNGLLPDGVAGKTTVVSLNTPLKFRIHQIQATLDRMRSSFRDGPESRSLVVNIPDFKLTVYNHGAPDLEINVVAGRPSRATPLFSHQMQFIILNPYWSVPKSIAVKDKLPLLRKNPNYLADNGMKLYETVDDKKVEVDPSTVDWENMTAESFAYKIVQDPGDGNALGRIKFMFPNAHDVYLHDTPEKHLFQQSMRAFSSGCIRLEKPLDLAEYLLADPNWTKEKISQKLDGRENERVNLPEALPIHLIYHTAWVDTHGELQFRYDVYKLDELFAKAVATEEAK